MTEDTAECQSQYYTDHYVVTLYTIIFYCVFPVLITIGILTNTLNIIVLTRPLMKGRTYRWLRALACVDLSLCILTIPVCIAKGGIQPFHSKVIAGYYAHFGWSLSIASQIISFYLMSMFAFERFLAVCRHDLYPRSQTDRVFFGGTFTAIIFVLALYSPTAVVGEVVEVDDMWLARDGYSQHKLDWYNWYAWVRELFSRLFPVILITYCNLRITLRLRQLRGIREGFGNTASSARKDKERRLVLLLFWVTILFYIFNAPVIVYYLGFLHSRQNCGNNTPDSLLIFAAFSNLLQMMGNVSNFILYFLISPDFHKTLCDLLCGRSTTDDNNKTISSTASPRNITITTITTTKRGVCDDLNSHSDSGYQHDLTDTTTATTAGQYTSTDKCYVNDAAGSDNVCKS